VELENSTNATCRINLYSHSTIISDFSIHLFYESNEDNAKHSSLALMLAANLKTYGLVNHNIWFQVETGNNKEKDK